jgi:hypothetical protein
MPPMMLLSAPRIRCDVGVAQVGITSRVETDGAYHIPIGPLAEDGDPWTLPGALQEDLVAEDEPPTTLPTRSRGDARPRFKISIPAASVP